MPDHGARVGDDFKSRSWLAKSSISLFLKQRQLSLPPVREHAMKSRLTTKALSF
jgi:hypothetical protein